jgi:hypothetical protein
VRSGPLLAAGALLGAYAAARLLAAASSGVPLRLPGPAAGVGLGEMVRGGTSAVGIPPCMPCQERAAALDRLVQFGGGA